MELILIFIGWWFWCVVLGLIALTLLGKGPLIRKIFWFLYGNRF